MLESGIRRLKDSVIVYLQNLPSESHAKHGRRSALKIRGGVPGFAPNEGGTAED